MIEIKIFDTHCDTVYELNKRGLSFDNGCTHLTKEQTDGFEEYRQVFAIWSNNKRSEAENWSDYLQVKSLYESELLPLKSDRFTPYLAVEGGALLQGKLSRLDEMKNDGVRMLTLVWKDDCCMGGAHNTDRGFTRFGKDALSKMFEIGIVLDVSHASDKMIYETLDKANEAGRPVCASHSNSRYIRQHTRNLTDEYFTEIKKTGGIVGISLCCDHLEDTDKRRADVTSVIRHIEHYMSLGGQLTVCLGCDFDGIEELPYGFTGARSLGVIRDELVRLNYSGELINRIMFENAFSFFEGN